MQVRLGIRFTSVELGEFIILLNAVLDFEDDFVSRLCGFLIFSPENFFFRGSKKYKSFRSVFI